MSEGEIKNFGKPKDLLSDETSVLFELTKKLSPSERLNLFQIANQHAETAKIAEPISLPDSESRENESIQKSYVNFAVDISEKDFPDSDNKSILSVSSLKTEYRL